MGRNHMLIRFACAADTAAILKIYAGYIETPVTFECVLPTETEFSKRMADISTFYPCLVSEVNGKVVGYAYAHRHMERQAYQWNAELSVYLDPSYTSKGLGKKLYVILMELLKCQGIRTVYAGVTVPNEKSESLHKTMGFEVVGTYRHAGFKNGNWHDVTWFEKAIAPYDPFPESVVSINSIPEVRLREIISSFQSFCNGRA